MGAKKKPAVETKEDIRANKRSKKDSESNDDNIEFESSNKSKSILKTNSNQLFQSKSCDSISSKATVGLVNNLRSNSNDDINSGNSPLENPSNVLVSTNSSKKSKTEGYEILVNLKYPDRNT